MSVDIQAQPDPAQPGRTAYTIVAATAEAVQKAIFDLTDDINGFANFIGPYRYGREKYAAKGEIICGVAS